MVFERSCDGFERILRVVREFKKRFSEYFDGT
jgi:hypothetical protein